ncbi:alpha/beta hydrolase family protein [Actinoplanes sichuanensis]|uniref:Alpha/beta hydrolase n=1 Tax=Actinoplanes sichuanensis TaxID=512349 RepID=A0ABW4AP29_9ACTN|nr:alpha/beta hydrolase family protein [Actinoplanes sichuanensis]BEL12409.1 alpha/beta hydrolase family protein [Actinoplanes sichuanensis]
MALIRCDFWSEALEMGTAMTVILPDGDAVDPPPVVYLLHGLTDDHTAWSRYSSVERYADDLGVAVVMPSVDRSFYANEAYGMRFWDFLSAELPERVGRFFRVSTHRADTFVAGLSMGGYGAMKWALLEPERFAAAASLSGALDLAYIQEHDRRPHIRALVARVFADRIVAGGDEDLMHLVRVSDPSSLPRLMLRCGSDDHLVAQNRRFVAACATAGVELDAGFEPGEHTWEFWDRQLPGVLAWLLKR